MHATSRLYRFVAPLAIVAISLVASSQASAQGFSGFGYPQPVAPYAYSPTAGHALGYVSSARPVMDQRLLQSLRLQSRRTTLTR